VVAKSIFQSVSPALSTDATYLGGHKAAPAQSSNSTIEVYTPGTGFQTLSAASVTEPVADILSVLPGQVAGIGAGDATAKGSGVYSVANASAPVAGTAPEGTQHVEEYNPNTKAFETITQV
jgi:hypothetical protein